MLLSEVYQKNKLILDRSQMIDSLITESVANGASLADDINKCGNGYLYYTVTASLSPQKKAPEGETFLCNMLDFTHVSSREDRGDAVDANGVYYEFKNSFTNQGNKLNLRQIRLWQPIDYYFCIFINEEDLDKSLFFVLTKDEMAEEVELCGGFTHGTAQANAVNLHHEYSITIPVYNDNNVNTQRWKEKYLSIELKQKILGGS